MQGKKRKKTLDYELQGTIIPRLWTLRRIPGRYQHLLPVALMKRHQCIVVGGERGILTVAITGPKNICVLNALSSLTGCTIFPVLVDPARMRLLIRRIERLEYAYYATNSLALYYALQQRSMLVSLISRYPGYFAR
jgi:Type II secretion system (T2SS), protein E, N-terminal domain